MTWPNSNLTVLGANHLGGSEHNSSQGLIFSGEKAFTILDPKASFLSLPVLFVLATYGSAYFTFFLCPLKGQLIRVRIF